MAEPSHGHRDDLLPLIVGGDIAVYALGRDFHEAYGIESVCLASAPITAISRSSIFRTHVLPEPCSDEALLEAICDEAASALPKTVMLMANTDFHIHQLARIRGELPENVVCPMPSLDVVELVSDKAEFARLAAEHGIAVPETHIVSFAHGAPELPAKIELPLVAKAAVSAEYQPLMSRSGFDKINYLRSPEELSALFARLEEAGFTGRFVLQKVVGGDDTAIGMFSAYVAQTGEITMFGSARVLLEDHAPTMLGNPVAMLTPMTDADMAPIASMLASVGYRGFANFDVKADPTIGELLFFELNPRIGRNSFYLMAAGVNPVVHAVADLVDGSPLALERTQRSALYTLVPKSLLLRYLPDELKATVRACYASGRVTDPQRYSCEHDLRRALAVELTELNQHRKFRRWYPKPTDNGL